MKKNKAAHKAQISSVEEESGKVSAPTTKDPFADIDNLVLDQTFDQLTTTEHLVEVTVRKPGKHEWVRTHPDPGMRLQTAILHFERDDQVYLVAKPLWTQLADSINPACLIPAVNRDGVLFIWVIKLPKDGKDWNSWNKTAMAGADLAVGVWARLKRNHDGKCYVPVTAEMDLGEPVFPDKSRTDLLRLAFGDRFIDSADHPVVRQLLGKE